MSTGVNILVRWANNKIKMRVERRKAKICFLARHVLVGGECGCGCVGLLLKLRCSSSLISCFILCYYSPIQ